MITASGGVDLAAHVALVVDDSPETLGLLNDALDGARITVLLALDGVQALSIAERMAPDIVLLDAIMPQMDGFETCRRIKALPKLADVPVIFMTGLSDTESVVRGLNAGGVDFLTKPIDMDELIARMRVHLGNARRTQSVRSALNRLGQCLFGLRTDGTLEWATEQTQALLARVGLDEAGAYERVYQPVARWHASGAGGRGQYLKVAAPGGPLVVHPAGGDGLVFRLADPDRQACPADLRKALPLTEREAEVLYWIAFGKTNREIATILNMSPRTVNKHLETVFPKLGVENRTAAAAIAIRALEQ